MRLHDVVQPMCLRVSEALAPWNYTGAVVGTSAPLLLTGVGASSSMASLSSSTTGRGRRRTLPAEKRLRSLTAVPMGRLPSEGVVGTS
mmetsp:Transcript_55076/g.119961  ORF Transcript_55076/g.119961 Transcript_55076/m.119961 type:complete len:88 (-) Transcript_55076:144-407(-)